MNSAQGPQKHLKEGGPWKDGWDIGYSAGLAQGEENRMHEADTAESEIDRLGREIDELQETLRASIRLGGCRHCLAGGDQ